MVNVVNEVVCGPCDEAIKGLGHKPYDLAPIKARVVVAAGALNLVTMLSFYQAQEDLNHLLLCPKFFIILPLTTTLNMIFGVRYTNYKRIH